MQPLRRTTTACPTVALRYFTVYGPRQRPDMALHRLHRGRPRPARRSRSTATARTSATSPTSATSSRPTVLAGTADVAPGTVVNICAGGSHRVRDLIDAVGEPSAGRCRSTASPSSRATSTAPAAATTWLRRCSAGSRHGGRRRPPGPDRLAGGAALVTNLMGPRLIHVTTTDMSLDLLLGPQLRAFAAAGYEVHTAAGARPATSPAMVDAGITHHHVLRHATRSFSLRHDLRGRRRAVPAVPATPSRHRAHPQPQARRVRTGRRPGPPGCRSSSTPRTASTRDPTTRCPTPDRRSTRSSGSPRPARDVELVQNPEDVDDAAPAAGARAESCATSATASTSNASTRPSRRRAAPGPGRASASRTTDVVVGAVGRLVWEKGYRELFAAAAMLLPRAARPAHRGRRPRRRRQGRRRSPDRTSAPPSAPASCFLGMRTDVDELYPAMDLYVLASHREGFPRSAMEAAAMGLPVVATDIRGCRQVVDDGVTGLLVAPRRPADLAAAIRALATDPALRQAMGPAARARAESGFDQRRVVEITLEAYRQFTTGAALSAG